MPIMRHATQRSGTVATHNALYEVRNGYIQIPKNPGEIEAVERIGFQLVSGQPEHEVSTPAPAAEPEPTPAPAPEPGPPVVEEDFFSAPSGLGEVIEPGDLKPKSDSDDDDDALVDKLADGRRRCQHITMRGAQCKLTAMGDTAFCHLHQG